MVVVDRQLHAGPSRPGGVTQFDAGLPAGAAVPLPLDVQVVRADVDLGLGTRSERPRVESEPGPGGAVGELDGFEREDVDLSQELCDERAVRPLVKLLCAPILPTRPSLRTTIWSATSKASRWSWVTKTW